MKKIILILITLSVIVPTKAQDVLIYSDDGTWLDGIIALEKFFEHQNVTTKRIYAADLNADTWNKEAEAILFPGGYSYNYQLAISLDAVDEIRSYVSNGGAYIGICAGAYFASKTVEWEGGSYPYELALFDGTATGSLDYIAPWPEYKMTQLTLNTENPINSDNETSISVLYYGGPIFTPNTEVEVNTVATWDDANNSAAIINFEYEDGRVLLLGPHLEIEEDDDRDGTVFAAELTDVESDWGTFLNGYNWVTNNLSTSVDQDESDIFDIIITNDILTIINLQNETVIEITEIYSITGELVLSGTNRLNISDLVSGTYLIKAITSSGIVTNKINIVN
jgi:glutamine amidotransferase-like uncharacterized protein